MKYHLYILFFIYVNTNHIQLDTSNNLLYVNVLTKDRKPLAIPIDTSISKSLLASPKCKICDGNKFQEEGEQQNENLTYTKSYSNYSGNEYLSSYEFYSSDYNTDSNYIPLNYISFQNVTLRSSFSLVGFLSMSYTNKELLENKTISKFAFDFRGSKVYLDLNETNPDLINTTEQLYDVSIENDTWFLTFDNLTIKKGGINISNFSLPQEDYIYKLNIDSTIWDVKIPKDFFFSNIEQLFPSDSTCQVQLNGMFLCSCTSQYADTFPTFYFRHSSNMDRVFQILPSDYIEYAASIEGGGSCYVFYKVNYESNYWVTGINVMNNYYCVFDLEGKKFALYEKIIGIQANKTFTVFISVFVVSLLVLFGGHFIYKKYVLEREEDNQ